MNEKTESVVLLTALNAVLRNIESLDLEDLKARAHGMAPFVAPGLSVDQIDDVVAQAVDQNGVTLGQGSVVVDPATFTRWLSERKLETDRPRSRAYTELLMSRLWAPRVVDRLDEQTDQIIELVGDPKAAGPWKRRGLAIGEVQSGKTSTYIGLLSKAIDYGYKVLVVIGGHTEDLRRQTQGRLDSDLTGLDSAFLSDNISVRESHMRIGIGKIDANLQTHVLTTTRGDFNAQNKRGGMVALGGDTPTLFVVKKNAKVLQNLAAYLRANIPKNANQAPLLLIDDEADWASINVNDEENITAVNNAIRDVLASSNRNSYLGITATPFANVFIDDSLEEDLFPRDYIQALESPSNYFGVGHYFGTAGSASLVHEIDDFLQVLPYSHKRTHRVDELPESLEMAVCTFVVGAAIRRSRDGTVAPSSMLINVSRFNDVQSQVSQLVAEFVDELSSAVLAELGLPEGGARSRTISILRSAYDDQFTDSKASWNDLRPIIVDMVGELKVELINSQTKAARERSLRETPRNVREAEAKYPRIYVGGDVLSRGLTLEGLQVSYYLRKTGAASTLLQMGRWFGYRPGYDDLIRIWMDSDIAELFRYTAELSDELRLSLAEMNALDLKPTEFGIKLRRHPEGFLIAATRQMRNAVEHSGLVSINGQVLESVALPADESDRQANLRALTELVGELGESEFTPRKRDPLWTNVPRHVVEKFLGSFRGYRLEPIFGGGKAGGALLQGIDQVKNGDSWDIVLMSGQGLPIVYEGLPQRNTSLRNQLDWGNAGAILLASRRVAAGGDLKSILQAEQRDELNARGIDANKGDRLIARTVIRRPTLMLYAITSKVEKKDGMSDASEHRIGPEMPLVGVVAVTPSLNFEEEQEEIASGKGVRWQVNTVFARIMLGLSPNAEDDEYEEGDE